MSSLLYLLDHKNLFKSEIVQNRARRMNIKAVELLCEMLRWCQVRGIDPVVTETVTTIGEDNALKRVSSTHREGRAFDIRTRGWIKKDIEDFMAHFNDKHWSLGAISAKTGKPNLIVHHDAGTGPHFHVQLAKKYALSNPLQVLASDKEVIEANQEAAESKAAVTPIAALKEEFEKRLKTAVANDAAAAFRAAVEWYIAELEKAFEKRDSEAKTFCRLYNESLDQIVNLKKRLGEDPGDY